MSTIAINLELTREEARQLSDILRPAETQPARFDIEWSTWNDPITPRVAAKVNKAIRKSQEQK